MGWLEGYQIRLWPRSQDNVPLFLPPPPTLTVGCSWCLAISPTAAPPVPVACPHFPGSWALGAAAQPQPTPRLFHPTWSEAGHGEQVSWLWPCVAACGQRGRRGLHGQR